MAAPGPVAVEVETWLIRFENEPCARKSGVGLVASHIGHKPSA